MSEPGEVVNTYFGEHWGAPMLDGLLRMPTPVDDRCLACDERFVLGDQGLMMPYGYVGPDGEIAHRMGAEHRECLVLGVAGHLAGQCYCYDGLGTARERGRATVEWLRRNKIAKTN